MENVIGEIEPPGPDMRFFLSHHGRELPNARLVSNKIHGRVVDAEDTDMSLMVMQFGKYLYLIVQKYFCNIISMLQVNFWITTSP